MSTVAVIPFDKSTEVADLVADKQPGDRLYCCATIKALDDQSVTIRIEEVTDKISDLPKPEDDDEDDDDAEEKDSIEERAGNGSSPDESAAAIKLAAPGGYVGP